MIVDLGGGLGGVLAGLLRSDPRLEGILVDLPHVIEGASARLDAAGVLDRCRLVAGSFFERIPEGGDIYVLRYILHDWDDERAGAILRRCREAMHERARLVVAESVLPEREPPVWLVMQDLHMLTLLGGRERTEREYESLFRRNGFALRSRASVADTDVLEAVVAGGGA